MSTKSNLKKAFTLAEVLITLGIIGVVAAMTIPTLMNKTNDAENKSAFKKAYSEISQSIKILMMENGGTLKGAYANSTEFNDALSKQLKTTKVCVSGDVASGGTADGGASPLGCFHHNKDMGLLNGADNIWKAFAVVWPGFVLSDGALFATSYNSTCTQTLDVSPLKFCGWFQIDVNGFKKPNVYGKDILDVGFTEDSIVPFGIKDLFDSATTCNIGAADPGDGSGCAARYLYK